MDDRPITVIDDSLTRVLLSVLAANRPTVSTCVQTTGLTRYRVDRCLHRLRDMGLIAFEDGAVARGTLRPLIREYPLLRQPPRAG